MTQEDAKLLGLWIKKRLALGSLPEKEILNLAVLMSHTSESGNNDEVRCTLAGSLFEGLQSSTVLGLHDVTDDVPGTLLEAVAQRRITRRLQALGIRILEALQPEQLRRSQASIARFFQKTIQAQACRDPILEDLLSIDAVPRSLEILRSLPENMVHDTILQTSQALLELRSDPSISRQALAKLLDMWWSSLAKSDLFDFTKKGTNDINNQGSASTRSQRMLANQPLSILAPYLRHFDDEGKARYLVRHWICPALPPLEWKRAMNNFFKLCKRRKDESPFLHFIKVAHDNSQLPDQRIQRLFRLLQMMQMSETIEDILVSSERDHVPISEAAVLHSIRAHMAVQPQMAERLLSAYPRLPLERCPELVHNLILDPSMHPETTWRHYQCRKSRAAPGATLRERRSQRTARARLLGTVALAYSKALHLTPRMAFRRVYRCYICITEERLGGLPVNIILALVRSGIVRPLQTGSWVSTMKHRWILSLIRNIESPEDADKVDRLVYQWRGLVARQNRSQTARIRSSSPWLSLSDMNFKSQTRWSRRWSRYERVITPLKRP